MALIGFPPLNLGNPACLAEGIGQSWSDMITAKQSGNGKIAIPRKLRGKLRCKKGDIWEFIPSDEDPNIITMRRVTRRRNEGLAAHLAACPHPFEIPALSREMVRKIKL